jgi:hypothetical protein
MNDVATGQRRPTGLGILRWTLADAFSEASVWRTDALAAIGIDPKSGCSEARLRPRVRG